MTKLCSYLLTLVYRRGVALPPGLGLGHETDSELGHGADNDSLASFLSSVHGMTSHDMDNVTSHDMIPTRDSGLMAPRDAEFDTASFHSSNTMTTPQNTRKMSDKQPRYCSLMDNGIFGKYKVDQRSKIELEKFLMTTIF